MNTFTIKDLENIAGIKAHTIRIWEQRYSFLKPQRTETNIRYYSNDELKAILNISLLNKYGYKISYIDKMSVGEIRDKIVSLSSAVAQLERVVNDLIQSMIDLDIDQFEDILDGYIKLKGVDKAITQIIFPFLERIGILWLTNHINPAQEHLVINIIRQKLVVGIENAFTHVQVNKSVLLFLPEGEHHEIGLLYMYYLLKSRGVKVLYLGSNVPLKDVEFVANLKKPDNIYTHLTAVGNHFNFDKFLANAHIKLANYPLIISGQLAQNFKKSTPPNIHFKKSIAEVYSYISTF
jgi:MerR family transcriptional regulator, light-induced transcriptional regulator